MRTFREFLDISTIPKRKLKMGGPGDQITTICCSDPPYSSHKNKEIWMEQIPVGWLLRNFCFKAAILFWNSIINTINFISARSSWFCDPNNSSDNETISSHRIVHWCNHTCDNWNSKSDVNRWTWNFILNSGGGAGGTFGLYYRTSIPSQQKDTILRLFFKRKHSYRIKLIRPGDACF